MGLTNDQLFAQLQRLLTKEAARHGDGVEVQDRRGTGTVGISLFSLTGDYYSVENEWMDDDLDGLPIREALTKAWSVAYAKAEFEDRARNEK